MSHSYASALYQLFLLLSRTLSSSLKALHVDPLAELGDYALYAFHRDMNMPYKYL